jgi:hypothetical protein
MSVMPTGTRAPIVVPWGSRDRLELELPPDWPPAEVVWPDLDGAIDDYAAALGRALDAPEEGARIEDRVAPGRTVAIVVDDPSRWTRTRCVNVWESRSLKRIAASVRRSTTVRRMSTWA